MFQKKRELEEKIENLEFILSDKDRAIEELDEKLRSERTKFGEERDNHHQVLVWSDILLILFFPNILSWLLNRICAIEIFCIIVIIIRLQEIVELQGRIKELRNFKLDAESKLPDFVNVAAEKGDLEDQLRSLQKVGSSKA